MKDNFIEFNINRFNYIKSKELPNLDFLTPIIRRRLNKHDKAILYLLNKTVGETTKNIIFSSQTGELERLLKIIEQYSTEQEVSPNTFSGSVHNYPVGFFIINSKKSIPYNAVSAGENSISAGILATICDKYRDTVFCYCDIFNDEIFAFAISVNKFKIGKEFRLLLKNNSIKNDSFENYIKLFSEEISKLNSDIFTIERVKNA